MKNDEARTRTRRWRCLLCIESMDSTRHICSSSIDTCRKLCILAYGCRLLSRGKKLLRGARACCVVMLVLETLLLCDVCVSVDVTMYFSSINVGGGCGSRVVIYGKSIRSTRDRLTSDLGARQVGRDKNGYRKPRPVEQMGDTVGT